MTHQLSHLLDALNADHWRRRRNAARELGQLSDNRAVPRLVDILIARDERTEVRIEAAKALGTLGDPRAVEALGRELGAVWAEGNEDLGPQVAWALGEIGDSRAIVPLRDVLERREDDAFFFFIHREALFALAELGCASPVEDVAVDRTRPHDLRDEARDLLSRLGEA